MDFIVYLVTCRDVQEVASISLVALIVCCPGPGADSQVLSWNFPAGGRVINLRNAVPLRQLRTEREFKILQII